MGACWLIYKISLGRLVPTPLAAWRNLDTGPPRYNGRSFPGLFVRFAVRRPHAW
jgi:hypothetical protein